MLIYKQLSNDGNCLFGAVKLTKNVDIDLYKYSGYSIICINILDIVSGFIEKYFFQSMMKLVET